MKKIEPILFEVFDNLPQDERRVLFLKTEKEYRLIAYSFFLEHSGIKEILVSGDKIVDFLENEDDGFLDPLLYSKKTGKLTFCFKREPVLRSSYK